MDMTLIPVEQVNYGVRLHLTVAEAAAALGCTESRIRSAARRLGARKLSSGCTVRGGVLIQAQPVPIVITYSDGVRLRAWGWVTDAASGVTYAPDADAALTQLIAEREWSEIDSVREGRYIDDGAFLILRDPDGVEVLRRGIVP